MNSSGVTVIDTHIVDYLNAAMGVGRLPAIDDADLARQQVAVLRLYLWGQNLAIGRVAKREVIRTRNRRHRRTLEQTIIVQLTEIWLEPEQANIWRARCRELARHHPGRNDCLIVAEAELVRAAGFVTFDKRLIKDLKHEARVPIMPPSERWDELGIPHGTLPVWAPAPSNPLSRLDFWRW